MRWIIAALFLSAWFLSFASAQENGTPIITHPFNTGSAGTVQTGGTLPVTTAGTLNLALAANNQRRGCIIQNQGTHTMNVSTVSSMTNALQIQAGGSLNCAAYVMLIGDAIYITGTASDTFVIWWQ